MPLPLNLDGSIWREKGVPRGDIDVWDGVMYQLPVFICTCVVVILSSYSSACFDIIVPIVILRMEFLHIFRTDMSMCWSVAVVVFLLKEHC